MRLFRPLLTTTALIALAACGGGNDNEAPAPDTDQGGTEINAGEAVPEVTVTITDGLGQFDGTVSAIALWQHPTASFRSAILAANGEAGLFLIPMDRTAPTSVDGNFNGGVAIGYTGEEAIAAAYDEDLGGVRVFSVDPATRELGEFTLASTSDGAAALCFVGTTLVRVADGGAVYRHQLTVEDGEVILDVMSVPNVKATTCAGGQDQAYLLTQGGRVLPIMRDGTVGASMDTPDNTVALAAFPTSGDDELVFVGGNGALTIGGEAVLLEDGAGALAVRSVSAGGGNFGGAYREGALGIVSTENDLGAVSWLALTNTVGLDAKSISMQGENAGVSADLANQRATPDGELDTDLSDDAQEKLDGFRAPPGGSTED